MGKTFAYIGSWNLWGASGGLTVCEYDPESGVLSPIQERVGDGICVGHVWMDRDRHQLCCTDERPGYPGEGVGGGRIYIFSIDTDSGRLEKLDRSSSWGAQPSYLTGDRTGRYFLITNYGSQEAYAVQTRQGEGGEYVLERIYSDSSVVLLRRNPDGTMGLPCNIMKLNGNGPKSCQASSHAHSIVQSPDGRFFAVCDNGADRFYMLGIDYESESLVRCAGGAYEAAPGSMPRYCVFHPSLPYIYLNKESANTLTVLHYSPEGCLSHVATIPSTSEELDLRSDFMQSSLVFDKNGDYLYDLHRQTNTISVFHIDRKSGSPELISCVDAGTSGPRGCAISPDGRFLYVTGQTGNEISALAIGKNGVLSQARQALENTANPGTIDFYTAECL